MMKANFAIVLVPAFALALAVTALRRRRARLATCAGIAAAALALAVSYTTTTGTVAPPALGLGRLGSHLLDLIGDNRKDVDSYSVLFRDWLIRCTGWDRSATRCSCSSISLSCSSAGG